MYLKKIIASLISIVTIFLLSSNYSYAETIDSNMRTDLEQKLTKFEGNFKGERSHYNLNNNDKLFNNLKLGEIYQNNIINIDSNTDTKELSKKLEKTNEYLSTIKLKDSNKPIALAYIEKKDSKWVIYRVSSWNSLDDKIEDYKKNVNINPIVIVDEANNIDAIGSEENGDTIKIIVENSELNLQSGQSYSITDLQPKLKERRTKYKIDTDITNGTASAANKNAGWRNSGDNRWRYQKGNGYAIGRQPINGSWYYFDNSGYMKTGWEYDSGKWYYMSSDGSMKTGWIYDNGNWYFAKRDGEMQTGLIKVDGKAYYFSSTGAMETGNITIRDKIYSFAATGEAQGENIPKSTNVFTRNGDREKPDTIDNKIVKIELESNPTEGYEWQYDINKDGIIKEHSSGCGKNVLGSGEIYTWTFKGIKEGSTKVTFKYLKPGEGETINTRTYIFTVDKDLKITVKEIVADKDEKTVEDATDS